MELSFFDLVAFILFLLIVTGISLYASRKGETGEDYFLAGRKLTWWLIGFSLIASNISTEHFVGMAGEGFGGAGLAIASYEWFAAVTLVVVALFLLPIFLRLGIFTMPEFLEHRYGSYARSMMAGLVMVVYVAVTLTTVLFSGALGLKSIFGLSVPAGVWLIGILAGAYTIYGGLKAVVWSDLIQGAALLLGGTLVLFLAMDAAGGWGSFYSENQDKLHLFLPADHKDLPWTALLFGLWIPNFYYWGFNQFITQRTLGAKSLAAGQNGILLAAAIKLLIPFIIVFPGIIAWQLFADQISSPDEAYPVLLKNLLPAGLRGVMFAALFGAVMSSLDSVLNSASTIFTLDIYKKHFQKDLQPGGEVRIGRIMTAVFILVGCLIAPSFENPGFEGVFKYIQKFQGFISPGIVTVFVFGLINKKAPQSAAIAAMVLNIVVYGALLWLLPDTAFLNHMAITFVLLIAVMALITWFQPLKNPVTLSGNDLLELKESPLARPLGVVIILITVALYFFFR